MKDYPGVVVYEGVDYLGRKFFIISRGDPNKPLQVGSSCVVIQLNVGSKVDDSSEIRLYSEVPKALISECWAIFRLDTRETWLAGVFYSEMCRFYSLTGRDSGDLKSFINMLKRNNQKKFTLSQWVNFNYSTLFFRFLVMIRIFGKYDSQSDFNREIKNYLESSNFNWRKDFIFERVRDKFLNSDYIFISKVAPSESVVAETGFFTVKVLGYNVSARKLSFHMCGEDDPLITGFCSDVEECICYGKAPLSFIFLWNSSELGE